MSEPTTSQTVTISQDTLTGIAAVALLFAALATAATLAVSVITYDRALQHAARLTEQEERVRTLEAYESARRAKQ